MSQRLLLLFIGLFIFLTGCRQSSSDKGGITENADSLTVQELIQTELPKIYHRFPSPDEMLLFIERAGIKYKPGLMNNPSNAHNYLNSKSQALNLGVYVTDFAFISVFKRFNESSEYFESIFKLCENLQISSAFDPTILKRIENNISEPDSLKIISDLAFSKLNSFLMENQQEKTFVIISIGGFVEALYLSIGLTEKYSKDNMLVQNIADQKYVLENIISFAELYTNSTDVKASLELIDPIVEIYNNIEVIEEETKVTKNSDGKIVIEGGSKLNITEQQYAQLQLVVKEVRSQIIKN